MKHYVRVIPAETDNHIAQDSTEEEILACEEGQNWSLADFFQAFNDDEISSDTNWAFLFSEDGIRLN